MLCTLHADWLAACADFASYFTIEGHDHSAFFRRCMYGALRGVTKPSSGNNTGEAAAGDGAAAEEEDGAIDDEFDALKL